MIIDGGNTHYHDDIRHAAELREKGIHHVDVGTSGGVYGLERGFCLMIGGEDDVVERLYPLFGSIAPGVEAAARTPGRSGDPVAVGERVPALRPERRRALREDGPQRDRVRDHGRLRRGAEHPRTARTSARRCSRATPRPRRWSTPSTTSTTSTPRGDRGVAARQRGQLLAARPDRAGAVRVPDARGLLGPRVGLRRGTLDVDRGDRRGRPGAGAHDRAVTRGLPRGGSTTTPTGCCPPCASEFGGHAETALD